MESKTFLQSSSQISARVAEIWCHSSFLYDHITEFEQAMLNCIQFD